MNKQKKPALSRVEGLVPELRFSEFKNDGEWNPTILDDTGDIITGKTPSTKDSSLWDGEILFITPTDIDDNVKYQVDTNRKVSYNKKLKILPIGSIAYTCIASIGKIAITTKKSITNQQINSIVTYSGYNNEFIYYSLIHLTPKIKSVPATTTLPIINKTDFSQFQISIPKDPKEQKKIAQCLSSLDELIQVQTDKRDALRDHKKGLLQNLFPQEEQKVPYYRFSEFKKDVEWEDKKLDNLGEFFKGKGISKSQIAKNGKNPCIRYGELYTDYNQVINDIVSYTNVDKEKMVLSKKNDVLLPSSGETKLDIATASCVQCDEVILGGDINVFRGDIDGVFLAYYITGTKKRAVAKMSQGYSVVHLYSSQLKKLQICIPDSMEQNKIASCLLALDELIAAQTKKIEQLQDHKKGLMQKLFPKIKS